MKQSNFLSLNWRDMARALLVAVLAVFFDFLQKTFIPALDIPAEIKTMLVMGTAYLSKNFFTPADIQK